MKKMPEMPAFEPPTPDDISSAAESIRNGEATPNRLSIGHRLKIGKLIAERAMLKGTIAELQAQLQEAREALNRDPMTELLNSRGFEAKFADWLHKTEDQPNRRIAIIYMDIDGLRAFNNKHSHAAGDAAIKRFAGVLDCVTRKDDMVAHLYGDEFALGLPELRSDKANSKRDSEAEHINIEDYVKALPDRIRAGLREDALLGRASNIDSLDDELMEALGNIDFSHGGEVFDNEDLKRPLTELMNIADKKMFAQKHLRRAARA